MKAKYIIIFTLSIALALWVYINSASTIDVVFIDEEPEQDNTPHNLTTQHTNPQQQSAAHTIEPPSSQPEANDFEEFDLDDFDRDTFDYSLLTPFSGPVLSAQEIYDNALSEPLLTLNARLLNRPFPPAKSAEAEAFWDSIADVGIELGGHHEVTESLFNTLLHTMKKLPLIWPTRYCAPIKALAVT